MQQFYQLFKHLCASISLAILLAACSSVPSKPSIDHPQNTENQILDYNTVVALAEPERSISAIKQAQLALQNKETDKAESLLLLAQLNSSNIALHTSAVNIAATLAESSNAAHNLSDWFVLNQFMLTNSSAGKAAALRFKSRYAAKTTQFNDAATYSLDLSNTPYFNAEDAEYLWSYLTRLRLQQIESLKALYLNSDQSFGWLSLAEAYLNNGDSLQQQTNKIDDWLNLWPNHTAKHLWPRELALLQKTATSPMTTAAVVLPLSGRLNRAGKALQTAILAAHINQPQFKKLFFIDSMEFETSEALMTQINAYLPSVIIGPLDKNKAQELAQSPIRTAPLVSLNTYELNSLNSKNIQLSLNIEDEASYLANTIDNSMTHALIVATNNELAIRAAKSFKDTWSIRKDSLAEQINLADKQSYSKTIESGFLLSEAKSRQTKLENIFIETMESNPRRRQDISHIFLAASPNEARAINPLFAYHFANNIPVYAPSMIFDGQTNNVSNRDLNNITFTDTPWTIANTDPLKRQLLQHMDTGGTRSKNLHALGIDAYFIAARMELWKAEKTHIFNGRTGTIIIKPNGKTLRQPALAKIENQRVKAEKL